MLRRSRGAHRVERDRAAGLAGARGRTLGDPEQEGLAALLIPRDVHHDARGVVAGAGGDLVREELDRVGRAARRRR